ncbi:MAG TPA: helix-turn-helix transcriptional regulator [Niabella sp.]|nr:helix-turn-helix transcriptional regulator [Niabella sp.]
MIKNRKKIEEIEIPEFQQSIDTMPIDSKIFVEKSLEIVNYIHEVMELKEMRQKDLAAKMGKTEAELSKILSGMHNLTLRSISKLEAALEATVVCTPKSANCKFPKIENRVSHITIKEFIDSNIDQPIQEHYLYGDFDVYEPADKMGKSSCKIIKMENYKNNDISFDKVKRQSENQIANIR